MSFEVSWDDKVQHEAEEAQKVYNREVEKVSKDLKWEGKKDEFAVDWTVREVEIDAWFAKHHIEYLANTIKRQVEGLDRLAEKIVEAQEAGDTERAERLQKRWDAHYEKGEKHVEDVAASVAKHLERDARAAANHIVKGLARISDNQEDFDKQVAEAGDKVAAAIDKIVKDAGVEVVVED